MGNKTSTEHSIMKMRKRDFFNLGGILLCGLLLTVFDPKLGLISGMSYGSATVVYFVTAIKAFVAITLWHFSLKAIYDYFDMELIVKKAIHEPVGAGLALVAYSIHGVSMAAIFVATFI